MTSRSTRSLSLAIAAVVGASGLGLLPSAGWAAPLPAGYGAVTFLTFETAPGAASTDRTFLNRGDDGTNSTIRLEAGAPGTVASVRFEYDTVTPGFPNDTVVTTPIETVNRNDDGAFAVEWAGPPAGLPGVTYNVRAVGLTGAGSVASSAVKEGVTFTSNPGVNLTNGTNLGYFKVPYAGPTKDHAMVAVTGTRGPGETANGSPVVRDTSVGAFDADGGRSSTIASAPVSNAAAGAFAIALDLGTGPGSGAAGTVDQVALWADIKRGATLRDTDTEAFTLYKQAITTVTATPDRTNVSPGESASVLVTVTDQNGKPVVGAQVVQAVTGAPAPTTSAGTTDVNGQVTVVQAGGSTASYYANADDVIAFDSTKGDRKSADVAISNVQAVPTSLAATSADGAAFDLDETDNSPSTGTGNDGDATDVTVQVKDQQGNNAVAGNSQALEYYWTVTPFNGGASTRFPASGSSTGTPEGGGKFSVVVPAGGNGTYELVAGLTADAITTSGAIASRSVLSVKAGQAGIAWDKTSPQEAPAGTTSQVTGRLELPDGTGLPGRDLALTFQRDTNTADEDQTPEAGFASNGAIVTSTTVTTATGGAFSVTVSDLSETPQRPELGDNIDAASAANALGNAGASRNDQVVNFVVDSAATAVTLTDSREGVTLRAGEFTLYTVKVANRLGAGVAGQKVTLTTDKGYFSKDDGSTATTSPTASPAPVAGADAGTFVNDGRSLELTTGSDGTATVFLAMGRDTGFDDDGLLTSRVSAAAGTLSATDDHAWTSSNPLNGGTVAVVPSDKAQDSANLPKAQTSDKVYVDVQVTDQFGNAVGGENVTLTDDSASGTITESDGVANDGTIVSDFTKDGDATLASTTGTAQKVTASWTTERTSYTGTGSGTTTGTETLTGSYTAEWYAVDYAASTITLTPDKSGTQQVGAAVTMTYKALDQLGQPISDLYVDFNRTGPGTTTDPATASDALTGADGIAAYTFTGASSGKADVTATARQGSATGEVVTAAGRSASVTFGQDQVKPDIAVTKRVKGNRLILKVAVTASTQDPVTGDVRLSENGDTVATKVLNSDGERKFVIRGVEKGFHSYQVTFLGNDEVKARTRTVTINIR